MIAIPAVDLKGGNVVQLVGGRPEQERLSLPEPVGVAHQWVENGFGALHVIDLDAALGSGENRAAIREILEAVEVPVQVGGGVRDEATLDALLADGAARVIVGTRAIAERAWLRRVAERNPGRVVLAADVRNRYVVTHGWARQTQIEAVQLLVELDDVPLAGVLVTDVEREGGMAGADVVFFETLVGACAHPLFAAGGIAGEPDLAALAGVDVAAAILGMALYTGALDAPTVARSYHE
jgi:phosphoribosylformimino-5-aminoimidazole carboxamide ribotide isomerase